MNWLIWIWFFVSTASIFYVIYQANCGKEMTSREFMFFFLGVFSMGVPFFYLYFQ